MNINEFNRKFEIEKSNLKLKILHRSLFILKKKFEIYKEQINKIYLEYKQNEIDNPILTFPIEKFPQILNNIFMISQIMILPFNNYHELINDDFIINLNKEKNHIIIKYLTKYVKDNIQKYNQMFYIKKMRIVKNILINKPQYSNEEIQVEFTLYDKRGNIKKKLVNFMEENKELDLENEPFLIFENDIDILNSNKSIYSQTIPLIIADYIENNENLLIISLNDELNDEIKYYFDDEINTLISNLENVKIEENNNEIKTLLLKELNLEQKILYYNNIIKEKKKNIDKIIELNELKSKLIYEKALLYQKKMIIQKQSLFINKSFLITHHKIFENKKYKRIKIALERIFNFYSKQYLMNGKFSNIDTHIKNKDYMDEGEFYKFCIEFKLNLTKKDIIEIFRTSSSNENEINFKEFLFTLEKIANIFNKNKINEYEKIKETYIENIKKCELGIINENEEKKQQVEQKKGLNNENKEEFFENKAINILDINYNKNELNNKLEEIKEELNELYNKSKEEKLKELYDYMDLDRPNDYKKKLLGFTIPFNLDDKTHLEKNNKLCKKVDEIIIQNIIENQNSINNEKENKSEEIFSNKFQIFKTQIETKKEKLNNNFINEKNQKETIERRNYINVTGNKSLLNKINSQNIKKESNKRTNSELNNIIYKIKNSPIIKPFNGNDIYLNKLRTKRYGSCTLKITGNFIIKSLKKNSKNDEIY